MTGGRGWSGGRVLAVVAVAGGLLVGCSASGSGHHDAAAKDPLVAGPKTPTSTTSTTAPKPITADAALDRARPVVASVITPHNIGSGLVLSDGYVVTTAHAVEPFAGAIVAFDDGTERTLPVVGVDRTANVAVLGPIRGRKGIDLTDLAVHAEGETLYLAGFPTDDDDFPKARVVNGYENLPSPRRSGGRSFVAFDVNVADGELGGPVLDGRGNVVGLAVATVAREAYALPRADLERVEAAIRQDGGDPRNVLPDDGTTRSAHFSLGYQEDWRVLEVFPSGSDRTVRIQTGPGQQPTLEVDDGFGGATALNQAAFDDLSRDREADESSNGTDDPQDEQEDPLPPPTKPAADGSWTLTLASAGPSFLYVGSTREQPGPLDITSSAAFAVVRGEPVHRRLPLGITVSGSIDAYDPDQVFDVVLRQGQEVRVEATSTTGDLSFSFVPPGKTLDDSDDITHGAGGMLAKDPGESFTATVDGTYRVVLWEADGYATNYQISARTP